MAITALAYGVWALFIPEPIVSKFTAGFALFLGGIGWWTTTQYCGSE